MVDKAKLKDILLWTVYTNVIDHKNIRYQHAVDMLVNKRCKDKHLKIIFSYREFLVFMEPYLDLVMKTKY